MSYIGASPTSAAFLTNSFSGDGTTTSFTLTVAPASSSSILVAVSGVLQDPATYAVVGTSLNFTGAPPSGTANIIVRFLGIPASNVATASYRTVTEFTATAAQTTFSVPSYTPGFIDVYRNGVMLGSADYTATNGTTVVLATGATAGDLIEVISFYVSSIYNAISNTAGSVNANNIADGAVGTSEIASGVTINFADGSASAPSITNDGDTNTGLFFPSADSIGFAEGGAEVARFDSSGNLLVGTTSVDAGFGKQISLQDTNYPAYILNSTDATNGRRYLIGLDGAPRALVFRNQTAATEIMRIDSAGRVTTPFQPAFWACAPTASGAVVTTSPMQLPARLNNGSHYNASNGRFTAPVSGMYQFSLIGLKGGSGGSDYWLRINGTNTTRGFGNGGDETFGVSAIFQLNANDYVDATTSGGSYYTDYTNFSGFLIG